MKTTREIQDVKVPMELVHLVTQASGHSRKCRYVMKRDIVKRIGLNPDCRYRLIGQTVASAAPFVIADLDDVMFNPLREAMEGNPIAPDEYVLVFQTPGETDKIQESNERIQKDVW